MTSKAVLPPIPPKGCTHCSSCAWVRRGTIARMKYKFHVQKHWVPAIHVFLIQKSTVIASYWNSTLKIGRKAATDELSCFGWIQVQKKRSWNCNSMRHQKGYFRKLIQFRISIFAPPNRQRCWLGIFFEKPLQLKRLIYNSNWGQVRWVSGLNQRFAKPSYFERGTESSNLSLTAQKI